MVRKGEYLERAVVIPGTHGTLEGLFHRGAKQPPMLIAPQHPLGGGSMESAIIAELAWAVTRKGHATLRFNYRGVGASEGSFTDVEASILDATDAAEHLKESVDAKTIAIAGLGYGASVAARLALSGSTGIEMLILIAPDPAELPPLA